MRSSAIGRFWRAFASLPEPVQSRAREAFKAFESNPFHPSLHFKQLIPDQNIWSVRVGRQHRAMGRLTGDRMEWFWIGTHDEYERIYRQ